METLYDVLGAGPDDDAESLKKAYRKAAKANHPDLLHDDPEAVVRFTRIARAYDILRDAKRRTAYDRCWSSNAGRFVRKQGASPPARHTNLPSK